MPRILSAIFCGWPCAYLLSCAASASPRYPLDDFLHPEWLALVHYQPTGDGWESSIDAPEFFLSPLGKTDPQAEMRATIQALQLGEPRLGVEKLDPLCAFPARARWLQNHLGLTWRQVNCEGYHYWRQQIPIESLSIVFASAYPGNPSSILGHTFLKVNLQQAGTQHDDLLDYTVAYAAQTGDENFFIYAWRGMVGGYRGYVTVAPYYEQVATYAYRESRDLWEYKLPLNAEELERFLAHTWELSSTAYADYYFFSENCSYFLLEMLDAARPSLGLARSASWMVLPYATVQGVLEKLPSPVAPQHVPAQAKEFSRRLQVLSAAERQQVDDILSKDIRSEDIDNPWVIDALLAWYGMRKAQLPLSAQSALRAEETPVLKHRSRLGRAQGRELPAVTTNNRPDLAHPPHRVAFKLRRQDDQIELGARVAYGLHDLLDANAGMDPYYQVNWLDLTVMQNAKAIDYQLHIADIVSLQPITPYQFRPSYQFTLSVQSLNTMACQSCPATAIGGGVGAGWEMAGRLLVYSIPTLTLESSPQLLTSVRLRSTAPVALLWQLASEWRLLATYAIVRDWDQRWQDVDRQSRLEVRWDLTRKWQIAAAWQKKSNHETTTFGLDLHVRL